MFSAKRSKVVLSTVCALGMVVALTGCGEKQAAAPRQVPPTEVSFVPVALGEHQLDLELTGRAHALREAEVRPQVNGLLLKRVYTEGADVKKGDVLFQIDPAPFEAALASAQATLAQAKATLTKAKADADRSAQLVKINAVSKQANDAAQAAYLQAQASMKAAEAAVSSARINLNYTRVTSPIDGVAGRSEFTEGALMTAYQASELTTVQQLDPMYVDVVQTADNVLALKSQIAQGLLKTDANGDAKVTLKLSDGSVYAHEGKLTFRGVSVDESTGAVKLRMEFPNPERLLMPGLYVKASLATGGIPNSTLVPMQAVMHDAKGQAYVYLIGAENKIERRNITTQGSVGSNWLVTSGLQSGEKLVVDGFSRIAPGKVVAPKEGNPDTISKNGQPLF